MSKTGLAPRVGRVVAVPARQVGAPGSADQVRADVVTPGKQATATGEPPTGQATAGTYRVVLSCYLQRS